MSIYMTGSYFHKKIILIVALVAFLVGGFFPVSRSEAATPGPGSPAANAQRNQPTQQTSQSTSNSRAAALDTQRSSGLNQTGTVDAAQTGRDATNTALSNGTTRAQGGAETSGTEKNDQIYCFDFGGEGLIGARFSPTGCVAMGAFILLGAASWVLWLSAILFNSTINYTLNMAGFLSDIPIVALGWTTFRDLANLFFVFIILYIAINTIVGNEGYGIKKLLGKVIVTAMLINFSLFFTQALIDGSNIMALQFYHKILQDSKDSSGKEGGLNSLDGGISAAFVKGLGLQEVFGIGQTAGSASGANSLDPNDASTKKLGLNSGNLIIVGFGGTVLVLITAFIFFAATLMFLLRTVTLVFLMILSPLAFMGSVLPALGDITKKWWSKLFNNLLFAPAYMTLLYLVISMITKGGFKGVNGGGSFYQLFSGNENMIGAVMTFVVLNALMVGCLLIASSFGVAGSKWAEKTGMGLATNLGMTFGGGNLLRSGLGLTGSAITRIATPLASTTFGRVIGGGSLLRGGSALQNIKVGDKSYKDAQKEEDDLTKKTYDLAAETNQGRWESNDAFSARKKRNQARAYGTLGIAADRSTGLPIMTPERDASGKVIKSSLKQKIMGVSGSKKRVRSAKDINEEGLQKKQTEKLVKTEQDAYDDAKKVLTYLVTSESGNTTAINAAKLALKQAKYDLHQRKHDTGLVDNGPKGRRP